MVDMADKDNDDAERIKNQKAVAIKYEEDDVAPRVVAKGQGYVAERILESALGADIPVHKDTALVEKLTQIDIGANIPRELYEIIAQILIFIGDVDKLESMRKNERNKL